MSVFSFWCINHIATEIEQPFGDDANDLPIRELQEEVNHSLLLLLSDMASHTPTIEVSPQKTQSFKNQLTSPSIKGRKTKRLSAVYEDALAEINGAGTDETHSIPKEVPPPETPEVPEVQED